MARLVPLHLHGRPRSRSRARVLLGVLALALVASVGLPTLSPAQADEPFPPTPRFGPAIDAYAAYEPESGCHAGVQPGLVSLVGSTLRPAYGGSAGRYLTERTCSDRSSGHEEGRALDWMLDARVPGEYATAKAFLDWLLATDEHGNRHAMARRLGITYVLYNNQMWRAYRADEGWMPQRFAGADCAALDASYATKCHRDHVHISMSWAGALQQTSWWRAGGAASSGSSTGGAPSTAGTAPVIPVATCPVPEQLPPPASPSTAGMAYVPLPRPARILETSRGVGSPGTCRLGDAGRLDVQVTGRGGVPRTGVGAVVLNVAAVNPSKSTSLAAYPAGLRYPGTNTLSVRAGGARSTSIVLPVGTDGRVSLLNAVGQVDVVAEVLGYYPTPEAEALQPGTAGPASADEELELEELEDGEAVATRPQPLTYHPTAAVRVADSRDASPYAAGRTRTVQVTETVAGSRAGARVLGKTVPAAAKAVVVNVTAHSRDRRGSVSVVPDGVLAPGQQPPVLTTIFGPKESVSNRAVVPLSPDGTLDVHVTERADVVLDVVGWYGAPELPGGTRYVPVFPARVLDTRAGFGIAEPLGTRAASLTVAGRAGVPFTGAQAVVMTLTGWQVSGRTSLTTELPGLPGLTGRTIADLHVAKGETAANLAVAAVRTDGTISLDNASGQAQVLGELLGYYR